MTEIYWHRGRRLWSVREGGRVVSHVPAISLSGVAFRASEASRVRCLRTGARDVHAWAAGTVAEVFAAPREQYTRTLIASIPARADVVPAGLHRTEALA